MHNIIKLTYLLCGLFMFTPAAGCGAADEEKTDFMKLTAIPDGNYLVALQIEGQGPVHRVNIECNDGKLKCVNTDEPRLEDWKGRSMFIGNGVFMVQLAGSSVRATQFWVFRADGSAEVKELPDRGEKQKAVPIKGNGLK
jgi:hypothetical protein